MDSTAAYYDTGAQRAAVPLGAMKGLDRPMTETEEVTARMADAARRLTNEADAIHRRLDSFMQASQPIGGRPDTPSQVEPQPGTLGAMRYWQKVIEEQAARIADASSRLAGII